MATRADSFLDLHLLPLFDSDSALEEYTVAIVSHGILLSNLWRRLLLRLPRRSLTIAPEVTAAKGDIILEHLGGWSNTGYLHLTIRRDESTPNCNSTPTAGSELSDAATDKPSLGLSPVQVEEAAVLPADPSKSADPNSKASVIVGPKRLLDGHSTRILAVDSKQHLVGLKRQRGGIGRSAHDESQKKLDGFFKKQRTG